MLQGYLWTLSFGCILCCFHAFILGAVSHFASDSHIIFCVIWSCLIYYTCSASLALPAGATSLCVFWGPVVGARVLSYRTALLLEVMCQIVGNVAFGPHYLMPYSGFLKSETEVRDQPELVIYALLCVVAVLAVWHTLAFWQRVPSCPYTELGRRLLHSNIPVHCCQVLKCDVRGDSAAAVL